MSFAEALALWQQGRVAEAGEACRRALAADPGNVPALHMLGHVALHAGRVEEAVACLGRAHALAPAHAGILGDLANAHARAGRTDAAVSLLETAQDAWPGDAAVVFRLAVLLHEQGRLDDAITRYRQTLALEPGHVDAANNLGVVLQAAGRPGEAVETLRGLLARLSQAAPAGIQAALRFNLGNAEKADGRIDDAIASFRCALALDADFLAAMDNLGVAYTESGRAEEALPLFTAVLAREPASASTLANLSVALLALGRGTEALAASQRAIALRADAQTIPAFIQCVRGAEFTATDTALRASLETALRTPWCRPVEIARAGWSMLRADADLGAAIARGSLDALPAAFSDPLLIALLQTTPSCDWAIETWLVRARSALLDLGETSLANAATDAPGGAMLAFWCALAQQCYLTGYAFALPPGEAERAQALGERVSAGLAAGHAVPHLALAAVAAYAPLHALAGCAGLPAQALPEPVSALVRQQVGAPLRERALRSAMPALTPIVDAVSRSVRAQYESDPYPCWVLPAPTGAPVPLALHLRRLCPQARFRTLPSSGPVDLLIAGCGTGQHAIETARQVAGARVLAIDLSLASLAYARRKAEELVQDGIAFAQADIAALGTFARRFDAIESVGVLHHMADPSQGWSNLVRLLKPHGLLRVGLYSRSARQAISAMRERIAADGGGATPADIRRWRQRIAGGEFGDALASQLTAFPDFFTLAECRDLLFHVQEHLTTLPELKAQLAALDLDFIGFTLDPDTVHRYQARFPADRTLTDLDAWHAFETEHPGTFAGMYQFWVQRRDA
ncbi:MAG: tetratricopeptide repeat protein [Betaproteobacteria bacterium]|nr:tetratricopeptide repeat protein [Betaproteobacteria bacterium]